MTSAPVLADATTRVLIYSGALIVLVVVLAVVLSLIRRRLRRSEAPAAPPITLAELRALRNRSEISEAEFESLRSSLIRAAGSAANAPAQTPPRADPIPRQRAIPPPRAGEMRAPPGFDLTGAPLPTDRPLPPPSPPDAPSSGT